MVETLSDAVRANETRMLARLRALVEVESPSADKAAVEHAGALVAGWVSGQATVKRHKGGSFGDILELRFGRAKKGVGRVLLLGHLDTVWPAGTLRTMPWREADGKLFGPGVVDMKAGVVMALEALDALRANKIDRPVTLLLVSDEEVGSPASRPVTEAIAKDCAAVFVLEPAQGLAYKTSRKGVGHFTLRVQGVGAHAGVDFAAGHSAIREMARLVDMVSSWTGTAPGVTVNVGVIQGGTLSNVIAAECTAEVDVRIARAADGPRIERKFRSLKLTDTVCKLTVTGGINRPPMERKAGTVALFQQAQTLAREMGFMLDEASTGGGSDGNFTAALGIPTLDGMGAVGGGAHAAQEHVLQDKLVERTVLLAAMIAAA